MTAPNQGTPTLTPVSQPVESSPPASVPRQSFASWLMSPDLDLRLVRYRDLFRRQRLLSLANRPPDAPILTRKAFHSDDRKKVCEMALTNPNMSHQELARIFNTNKTTITRTLKHKEKWLRSSQFEDLKVARDRNPVYISLDCEMLHWLLDCARHGTIVTDNLLKDKAMSFARKYHLTGGRHRFTCSRTWLRNIKSKYGIVNGQFTDYSGSLSRRRDQALGYWIQRTRRSIPELAQASRSIIVINSSTPPLHDIEEPIDTDDDTDVDTPLHDSPTAVSSSPAPSAQISPIPPCPNALTFDGQSVPDDTLGVHQPLFPQSPSTVDWFSIPAIPSTSDSTHPSSEFLALDPLAASFDPFLSTTFFPPPTSDPAVSAAQAPIHDQLDIFASDPTIASLMDTAFEPSLMLNVVPDPASSSFQGLHGANFDQVSDNDFMLLASQFLFDGGDTSALPSVGSARGEQVNVDAALLEPWTTGDSFVMEGMPYPLLVPPS